MTLVAAQPRHLVTFYDTDESLALATADFLGPGLAAGGRVIVVATGPHRRAIARALSAAGIDLDEAREAELYVEMDAQELMSRLLVDGLPDPDRFAAAIAPLLEASRSTPQTLRVYGEMVDLMWQSGNVQGAHETEELWNSLGAGEDFALFCGYASMCAPPDTPGRHSIADQHHAVVDDGSVAAVSGEAMRQFEPTLIAPAAARRFVSETLTAWKCGRLMSEAELVVSELATNAVLHTGGRFTVRLGRLQGGGVRIEVSDGSAAVPEKRTGVPMDATNGRGIQIVSAIAQRWGVHLPENGKAVWAELAARPERLASG